MGKLRLIVLSLFSLVILSSCQFQPQQKKAKYVFLFIGDGMGLAQVIATEAFLAANDASSYEALNFRKFPYSGLSTTYAANRYITGSAAAGTALATGNKTAVGRISMDTSGTIPYESIALKAKTKGMKTGIISSVSIDHATPAVFYAHQPKRNMYFEIGLDLVKSNIDFFGGGGFRQANGEVNGRQVYLPDMAQDSGFRYINTKEEFRALTPSGEKILFVNPELTKGASMRYAIDQPEGYITLAEITAKAIEYLNNEDGFFIMVEGGKIDWVCHANDIASVVHEVIDFSEAVEEAIRFYQEHPDETLIVVTADHETGGLALGERESEYQSDFTLIANQDMSGEAFNVILSEWLKTENSFEELLGLLNDHFGIGDENAAIPLLSEDKETFENIFGNYGKNVEGEYGDYSPVTVKATAILARNAGLGWTSNSHTGIAVPVYATGVNAAAFTGNIDNTDIPAFIWDAME
jgi:alkaline phosphatase